MTQSDTNGAAAGVPAPPRVPGGSRLRSAAMVLTLAVGIPAVLAWFGLVGWGVLWLARNALAL
ncbi:hypothetical protein OPKNFCMD_3904 [Methylobacterium crusticola]|uniref:Phosphatidate cytidylyltransferase n=1 Tax=Methylobacterium crusticola TaxID=1697972 RepID=A0ABQ4R123_9HYPH|nr:hypothetical protein [Methylobacterium crusticola]GJD51152.1 hypothetical protein OPKNFCMD_3904 [Methylobacterium crusticola]